MPIISIFQGGGIPRRVTEKYKHEVNLISPVQLTWRRSAASSPLLVW